MSALNSLSSLKKISIKKIIGHVCTEEPEDRTISSFIDNIKFLEKKGYDEGYSNIEAVLGQDWEDGSPLLYFVEVMGERLETDEEWHNRLLEIKFRAANELKNAQNIVDNENRYKVTIEGVTKALKNNS